MEITVEINTNAIHLLVSIQVMSSQVRTIQVRSSQVRSSQVRLIQVGSMGDPFKGVDKNDLKVARQGVL